MFEDDVVTVWPYPAGLTYMFVINTIEMSWFVEGAYSLLVVVPSPSCPLLLLPQHRNAEFVSIFTQVCRSPHAIFSTSDSTALAEVRTAVGVSLFVVVPSPSWPYLHVKTRQKL